MPIKLLIADRKASVAPLLALAAVPLFASVGAAIDFSRASSAKVAMQGALDAAVIQMVKNGSNADAPQLNETANSYFNANFQNVEVGDAKTQIASSSTNAGYSVDMSASGTIKTRFMGIMGFSLLKITVRSSALASSDGLGCVLSLNRHVSGAATGQGTTAVNLKGCSLYDDSDDQTSAMTVGGSATISALSVGVVGKVSGTSNITATEGVKTGIGAVPDPYASVTFPAFFGCTAQNFTAKDNITIDPGVYCGGIGVNAGAHLTLNPGIYYLDGGNLSVNGGATLTGDGVTLVFTSKNRNGFATASINGNATINLTPPKSGPTAGIVIFADRHMPNGSVFKFNGGSTQYLGGAVYVPTGTINFSGGASTSTSCTQLIGDIVNFTGNSELTLNCSNYGTRPFSAPVIKITS